MAWRLDEPTTNDAASKLMDVSQKPENKGGWRLDEENQSPEEPGFVNKLFTGAGKIAEDTAQGAVNLVGKVPEYMQKATTEIPGLANMFQQHANAFMQGKNLQNVPDASNQVKAGLAELGQSIFNTPHDLINYAANRLNMFPKDWNKMVQMGRMPADTQNMINQQYGQPQQPGEAAIRGAFANAPQLAAVGSLLGHVKNAFNTVNPGKAASSIQAAHDALDTSARNIFQDVGKEVTKRNVPAIPLRSDLISDIADNPLMPKTKKFKDLLNQAHTGDFTGIRQLQSDMFHKGTGGRNSPLMADKNAADELFELRDELNNAVTDHFNNTGNEDLAKKLDIGKQQYKNLKDTYYGDYTPKQITDLVQKGHRQVPNNIMNVLSEQSDPMNRILSQNPIAANQLTRYILKQNSLKGLKTLIKIGLPLGTMGEAAHLYNKYLASH